MNIADQLLYITARIEAERPIGRSFGTGFFFSFVDDSGPGVTCLVTNKHVIDNSPSGMVHFNTKRPDGTPDVGKHIAVRLNWGSNWLRHPNPDVDLAVLPVGDVMEEFQKKGISIFIVSLNRDGIPDEKLLKSLTPVEDIMMVGYPIGLWDATNNSPIVRRGITATPVYRDFEGLPQFMIDCACFPGSSGSPVLLVNLGGFVDKDGNYQIGQSRIRLLGVLWGGAQHDANGVLQPQPVPTQTREGFMVSIPSNLGYVVKAGELKWFDEEIRRQLSLQAGGQGSSVP